MESEYDSLHRHKTWTLVPRPADRKVIPCKWVFKEKVIKSDTSADALKYKSILVAKGYTQTCGLEYEETFAPVARFTSIRILLALVAHLNLELHQMYVVNAFLNGELDETIYMKQPDGFVSQENADKVCLLGKALYGLKQANRQWYDTMDAFLRDGLGLTRNAADDFLYVRIEGGATLLIVLYVDDLLIACDTVRRLEA
jgi:Reverse transcriptase (RNA-dependent DNA polymerase)